MKLKGAVVVQGQLEGGHVCDPSKSISNPNSSVARYNTKQMFSNVSNPAGAANICGYCGECMEEHDGNGNNDRDIGSRHQNSTAIATSAKLHQHTKPSRASHAGGASGSKRPVR